MQVGNSDLCFTPKENLIPAHKGKINIVIFIFLIPDKKIQYKNLRHSKFLLETNTNKLIKLDNTNTVTKKFLIDTSHETTKV